ncbi:MAG: hypothetical protein ACE5HF_06655 [Gemmatimonadota bacterium]
MTQSGEPGVGRVLGLLVVYFVLGAPLALVSWRELSELLSGRVHGGPLLFALGAFLALIALTAWLRKAMRRLLPGDDSPPTRAPQAP